MTDQTLTNLKTKYNRIPLINQTFADLDTPVSAYLKLANTPYSYLFESVQGGEKWGRFSIIGLSAQTVIKIKAQNIRIYCDNKLQQEITNSDPLEWLQQYQQEFKVAPLSETKQINPELDNFDLFTGGLVGFFAYDCIRLIEPKLANIKKSTTADILLMVSEQFLVFDNLRGKIYAVVLIDPNLEHSLEQGQQKLRRILHKLQQPLPIQPIPSSTKLSEQDLKFNFSKANFKNAVAKIKKYINAGDVMQVVLTQKMQLDFNYPPIDLYRALRSVNPSPYMFYLHLDDMQIVGSSPEILVRLEQNIVTVRPLAGTRKRGKTLKQDKALAKELLADPKELAEHLMLIDLGRNDIGRVGKTGTVKMTETMQIEKYSHVMHIVSNVEAELDQDNSQIETLKATFPAGTVSGAPKIRAMEIINELEPESRGIYGGAVGYLGWHGNLDTAIAIRTAVVKDKQIFIQAGAGIVYDSDPDSEWQETMNKARAIINAAIIAADNLGNQECC